MIIEVQRFHETGDSTIGFLGINGVTRMFTLEDEGREAKVLNETRIPAGSYEVKLRDYGDFNDRYKARYPDFHIGMLELQEVPGFTDILIHSGNDDDDTSGCLLVGWEADMKNEVIKSSRPAYEYLYKRVIEAIHNEEVTIHVYDK